MAIVTLIDNSGLASKDFLEKLASLCERVVVAGNGPEDGDDNAPDSRIMVVASTVKDAVEQLAVHSSAMGGKITTPLLAAPLLGVSDAFIAGRIGFAGVISLDAEVEEIEECLKSSSGGGEDKNGVECGLIGESDAIRSVMTLIGKIADTDTTVLVCGESGTGKELIARALHEKSGRPGPFIPVNCGAIPAELLESELFGHEKGAFTNALRTRLGRFELADKGTIFLDEIAEMAPVLQVKLLRVLQEKVFERVGGARPIKSDFRVISATNRDLEKEVAEGRFREDLFYRLNVISIEAPSLRERPEDISALSEHFIRRFNRTKHRNIKGISPEAIARMHDYPWPGNVRELENVIERMVILAGGRTLDIDDLPEKIATAEAIVSGAVKMEIPEEGISLNEAVAEFEQDMIRRAMERTGWVKNRAAIILNLNRTTLLEKMKRYGMTAPSLPGEGG